MPVIEAHKLDLDRLPVELQPIREVIYNGMDCCLTSEIDFVLESLPEAADKTIYNFELALQAVVLEMTLRGFKVDYWERDRALAVAKDKLERTNKIFHRM